MRKTSVRISSLGRIPPFSVGIHPPPARLRAYALVSPTPPHGRSDSPPSLGESICRGRIYAALPFAFTIRVAYMRGAAPRSRFRPEREEPPPTPPRICRVRTTTPSFRRMPESRTGAFLICLDSGIRRNDERRSNPPLFSGWRGGVFWANMKSHSEVGKPSPMVGSHALRRKRVSFRSA